MRISNMLLGFSKEGAVEIAIESQIKHMCIIGAGEDHQESRRLNASLINHNLAKGFGCFVIQSVEDDLKSSLIAELKTLKRMDDFIEIKKTSIDFLREEILSAITKSKVLYFNTELYSKSFIDEVLNALKDVIELLRAGVLTGTRRLSSKPFIINVGDIQDIPHSIWSRLVIFARQLNIMFIAKFNSAEKISNGMEKNDTTIDSILEVVGTKIVFGQNTSSENEYLARLFSMPCNCKGKGAFLGVISGKKCYLLDLAKKNEFILLNEEGYELLRLPKF